MAQCKGCGLGITDDIKYCPMCGKENITQENQSTISSESIDTKRMLFVGKKYGYYSKQWNKKSPGFNWGAAFFGIFWLGYRKMYKYLFAILGLLIIVNVTGLLVNSELSDKISGGTSIALFVLFGIFGSELYRRYVDDSLEKIQKEAHTKEDEQRAIFKRGGTGMKHAFAALGLFILSIIILLPIAWIVIPDETVYSNDFYENDMDIEEGYTSTEEIDNTTDFSQEFMESQGLNLQALDVQFDMLNHLDEEFTIAGLAELDTYYNYGFSGIESEYFSVSITSIDPEDWDSWNIYFSRKDFASLYEQLKTEGQVVIGAKGIIPTDIYEDDQGNLALGTFAVWE